MIKVLAVLLFIVGGYIFGMSYHNIDLAVNASSGAIDTNGFGYAQDKVTMYQNGLSGLNISMISMISGFTLLLGLKEKKDVKVD